MTDIADFISADQIRSILTVSPADLPDSIIIGQALEDDIALILDKAIPGWEAKTFEGRSLRLLRTFVKYKAAAIVATTAPVFILKKTTDGNNEGQRSDREGFLWLSGSLNDKANEVLNDLLEEEGIDTYSGSWDLVGVSSPGRDVITTPREIE